MINSCFDPFEKCLIVGGFTLSLVINLFTTEPNILNQIYSIKPTTLIQFNQYYRKDRARVEKNYVEGGHRTEKLYTGRGDTTHTLLLRVTHGVGTPHNIERWGGGTPHILY